MKGKNERNLWQIIMNIRKDEFRYGNCCCIGPPCTVHSTFAMRYCKKLTAITKISSNEMIKIIVFDIRAKR